MSTDPTVTTTPVDDLTLHPANPREGDIGAIVTSIERNGWYGTIVAQASTRHVLAGNHRLQAARQLGIDEVPVWWVDCDDETALRILLADNRTSDLATNNDGLLTELLAGIAAQSVDDLLGTGYDGDDLDDLLGTPPPTEFPTYDEDIETDHECPKCGYQWS